LCWGWGCLDFVGCSVGGYVGGGVGLGEG